MLHHDKRDNSHVALWQRSYFRMLHHDKRDNFSCCIITNVIFLMLYYDNRDIFSCYIMTNVIFLMLHYDKRDIFSCPDFRKGTDTNYSRAQRIMTVVIRIAVMYPTNSMMDVILVFYFENIWQKTMPFCTWNWQRETGSTAEETERKKISHVA